MYLNCAPVVLLLTVPRRISFLLQFFFVNAPVDSYVTFVLSLSVPLPAECQLVEPPFCHWEVAG